MIDGELAPTASGASYAEHPYSEARKKALWDFERRYVEAVLAKTGGNITQAAKLAALDRSNFKRVLRRIQTGPTDDDGDWNNAGPVPAYA